MSEMSSVYKELDRLETTTNNLGELIAILEDKLDSVLLAKNDDTVAQHIDDGIDRCRLAECVHGVNYKSYLQLEELHNIINRLNIEESTNE